MREPMKRRLLSSSIVILGLRLVVSTAWADVRLPALVGNCMVLQRDAKIRLWGWADPGETIRIDFQSETNRARADREGKWSASVGPYVAGGPYDMVVAGKNVLVLHDILIGDVWLASGQSNMGYPLKGGSDRINNAEEEIRKADYPRIRLFVVRNEAATRPRADVSSDGWHAVTPQSVSGFSAVAYFFGRELHNRYHVPIGLIQSTWGGTVAETWMSADALQRFPEFRDSIGALDSAMPPSQNSPTILFNAMISPLAPFRIRGTIWYQGESNAGNTGSPDNRPVQYRILFPTLIEDWRRLWGYDFPFLFVQLPGYGANQPEPADYPWAQLREAQAGALILPNTAMATTIDLGDEENLHPRNKQDFAQRLALAAEALVYGERVVASGPMYQAMQIEAGRIRIHYSGCGSGLLIKDKYGYVRGFAIAGADGLFRWAQARQDGEDVLVFSEAVPQPVAVRYDWSNTPDGNVFNKEGLPAAPFRTDGPPPQTPMEHKSE
jgi:sialate O-acetylesterase